MASSSTSSVRKSFKYDVYLSFRGVDTRRSFVDHLYSALEQHGVFTYKDDERISKGKGISDELFRSIEDSRFYIIIFSKNYASSSWCLNELVKIMERHNTSEQTAYPVFFDVEPSEVRKQRGAVGEAFAKHRDNEAAGKWRQVLQEAADLAGWEMKNAPDGHEAKSIRKIVEEISLELRSVHFNNDEKLIGMERRIKEVASSLKIGYSDVHMMGIKGMGGIGKTTLARAIFDQVSFQFEGKSFVENVREVSNASLSGLKSLQTQVLSDVLNDRDIRVSSVYDGKNMMKKVMRGRKVLVVLDDVDHIDQLEALAGEATWFGEGSRIIITTRDELVLVAHGVKQIYHVDVLSDEEAICLFSRYAFGRDSPVQGYEQLSLEVVRYAAGLPLMIKVLGSFLCGKDKYEWIDALARLKTIPFKEIQQKLELSYISLEDVDKEIFLDVVCFMKGMRKNDAIRILESCGFPARNGLKVLEQKSLITISNQGLRMHDHIEEMGRNIVRRLHPKQPYRHSRLWIREEIEDVLANDLGTEETSRVELSKLQLRPDIVMEGFGSMKKLRCLVVDSETDNDDLSCDWKFNEARQYFPNALRFLRWVYYPVRCLPETFRADNLVALEMPWGRIKQLWEGGERKVLNNLRFLDLSYSDLETLDLRLTPQLEWLELRECHDLVKLHTPVGSLKRLIHLNLVGCSRFNSFLYIKHLESIGVLSLSKLNLNANSLKEYPRYASDDLPMLRVTCLYFEELPLPNRIGEQFVSIDLKSCTKLESVSRSICGLQHLTKLTFSGCIPEVPKDIDQLTYLEKLNLVSTHIKCLPDSICSLKHLNSLKIKCCRHLEKLPEGLGRLESLEKLTLLSVHVKRLPDSICKLKHLKSLKLKSCDSLKKLPEDIGQLECLEKLILTQCNSLEDIPNSICKMDNLKCFHLPFCARVKELPEELGRLTCLKELNVKGTGISHLPHSISLVEDLRIIGSIEVLHSCGLATDIHTIKGETFCYIPVTMSVELGPSEGVLSSGISSRSSEHRRQRFT